MAAAAVDESQSVKCTQAYEPGTTEMHPPTATWGRLVPLNEQCHEVELTFDKKELTLGRHRDCDVQFKSIHISSQHCRIYREDSKTDGTPPKVFIVDTSANGTFVNKERLSKNVPKQLKAGDTVSLVVPSQTTSAAFAEFIFQQLPAAVSTADATRREEESKGRSVYDFYNFAEELGSGSYATVYRARNKTTGEDVAIKVIDKTRFALLPSFDMDSLLREAELLKKLEHPNIIKLIDLFQNDTKMYIVMEYVTGGELFDRLVNIGPYTEDGAKALCRRLFAAIQYLHERNIVHRDLKPENILLVTKRDDTDIKVVDFGVAKTLGFEGLKTFCGSPQYFAPEVLQRKSTVYGRGRYGKGADMWSLGVILFILLSGAPPFDERTLEIKVDKVPYNFSASIWKTVSKEAKDLIRGLLNPDANARLTVDEALTHPWFSGGTSTPKRQRDTMPVPTQQHPSAAPAPTKPTAAALPTVDEHKELDLEVDDSQPSTRRRSAGKRRSPGVVDTEADDDDAAIASSANSSVGRRVTRRTRASDSDTDGPADAAASRSTGYPW